MNNVATEIYRLHAEGYCCSQIIIQMALDSLQDENPELVDAVAGLCKGLYSGLCCGALTGGACLLSMIDKNNARGYMILRLVEWFKAKYGGVSCDEILEHNPANMWERCPKIVEETFEKCREFLAEYGHEI